RGRPPGEGVAGAMSGQGKGGGTVATASRACKMFVTSPRGIDYVTTSGTRRARCAELSVRHANVRDTTRRKARAMTALWSSPGRRSERCAACADEQGVGRQ